MLIQVFGIWLMAANINWLEDRNGDCKIHMNHSNIYSKQLIIQSHKCDEVSKSINSQVKE